MTKKTIPIVSRVSRNELSLIDRTAEAIGLNRTQFIRQAMDILLKMPVPNLRALRRIGSDAGIAVSAIVREAIQPYVAEAQDLTLGISESGEKPVHRPILELLRQRYDEERLMKSRAGKEVEVKTTEKQQHKVKTTE